MEIRKQIARLSWQDRARHTEKLHKAYLADNPKHRYSDTARLLNRSEGRVSEDMMLASWMRTHPEVERFDSVEEAIKFVKQKKFELRTRMD